MDTPFKIVESLNQAELNGKRILVRADFNVPIEDGKVADDARLQAALPTINYLLEAGAKVILISHLGRKGTETLAPVAAALREYFPVEFCGLKEAHEKVAGLALGSVLVLENIRQFPEEESNDHDFAKHLAELADIYVNDAFSASHRTHASIVGVPALLPAYAGFAFTREYAELSKVLSAPKPFVLILGGAKFDTKLPVLERLLPETNFVLVGGALAHPFYKEKGYELGKSLIDDSQADFAALTLNEKLHVPAEVVVLGPGGRTEKLASEVGVDERIVDAGKGSIMKLASIITDAKFILWNGPIGNFEEGFKEGTEEMAKLIAGSSAYSIVGGGDTVAAIKHLNLSDKFSYLSTSGGAMLEFVAEGTLPGIKVLE